jgi:hypothetical protein
MSEEKDSESEPQKEQAQNKPRLNEEQHSLLKSCSHNKDIVPWNQYRREHPNEEVWLQGADLGGANLQDADLATANLQNAYLVKANLQGADLTMANLQGAYLLKANLQDAILVGANLQGAYLGMANLQSADLVGTNLRVANLGGANLQDAHVKEAHLEKARLWHAKLQGANCTMAVVDGGTLIWECEVNRYSKSGRFTNFEGVGLDSVRIDPKTKQLLEYNIRCKNWGEWYVGRSENSRVIRMRRLATSPARLFWSISDYGRSTGRIIFWFFLLAIIFATVYFIWGAADYYVLGTKNEPGIIDKLFSQPLSEEPISKIHYSLMIYLRAVYFSVVTMTTLGFGDMHANDTHFGWGWWFGHSLLVLQVLTGYVLLGALVTRFAILFAAGGPAGNFTKYEQQKSEALNGEMPSPRTKAGLRNTETQTRR